MPKSFKTITTTTDQSDYDSNDNFVSPRSVNFNLKLNGDSPGNGEWTLLIFYNDLIIVETKWSDGAVLDSNHSNMKMPEINLKNELCQMIVVRKPLMFLLRQFGTKSTKEVDPLLHPANYAGGNVDLFPLVLGEQKMCITVQLISIETGQLTGCSVELHAVVTGTVEYLPLIPLMITMISVNCLPQATKDGTFYVGTVGLNDICKPMAINFGLTLSTPDARKNVWAFASHAGFAANTAFSTFNEDKFIPPDFTPAVDTNCRSFYWNALQRVLVDPEILYDRLSRPFYVEIAGVPKTGKQDVRGRYMALIDASVLLEPGEAGVTTTAKLVYFSEANVPEQIGALLELPPTSAKPQSARDNDAVIDENGHNAFVVIRFELMEALVPKAKLTLLYEIIGFHPPEGPSEVPYDRLDIEVPREDTIVDVRRIKKDSSARAVHRELSTLSCDSVVPTQQGIKRTAANRLLMKLRTMVKSFPPEECSCLEWQETVTKQHSACRRAVTASFAPQPPPPRQPAREAAARSRIAGDIRIADQHIKTNLKAAGSNPRSLMAKTLRCLEERNDIDAKNYLHEALRHNTRNRYLLWILGGQDFNKGPESAVLAGAALRIAVKGDYSDGTSNAIGWAALHAFHHYNNNINAAFVAARKMRKAYSLPVAWKNMLDRWSEASGEEEIYWMPSILATDNPLFCAAAFFLCLRCYKFSEQLLQCAEQNCATRGSDILVCTVRSDFHYLRAASLLLRGEFDTAMETTLDGIKNYGPTPIMLQIRSSCYIALRRWDEECENALQEAEKAGSEICPAILYRAALIGFKTDPAQALQRVARIHKVAPSAHTAYLLGRIYVKLGDERRAERWLACAVKLEPLLSDAWAMLCLLAMYERNVEKARNMIRTARQVGPISPDIEEDLKKMKEIVNIDKLPEALSGRVCFCEYY